MNNGDGTASKTPTLGGFFGAVARLLLVGFLALLAAGVVFIVAVLVLRCVWLVVGWAF